MVLLCERCAREAARREETKRCLSVVSLPCELFCDAKNFFSLLTLQSSKRSFDPTAKSVVIAGDDVDHREADGLVSGSRCSFGQRQIIDAVEPYLRRSFPTKDK
jgi:hypothetical protein